MTHPHPYLQQDTGAAAYAMEQHTKSSQTMYGIHTSGIPGFHTPVKAPPAKKTPDAKTTLDPEEALANVTGVFPTSITPGKVVGGFVGGELVGDVLDAVIDALVEPLAEGSFPDVQESPGGGAPVVGGPGGFPMIPREKPAPKPKPRKKPAKGKHKVKRCRTVTVSRRSKANCPCPKKPAAKRNGGAGAIPLEGPPIPIPGTSSDPRRQGGGGNGGGRPPPRQAPPPVKQKLPVKGHKNLRFIFNPRGKTPATQWRCWNANTKRFVACPPDVKKGLADGSINPLGLN